MTEVKLDAAFRLRSKIDDLGRCLIFLDKKDERYFQVRDDEPYYEEIKELVKKKRQQYLEQLKNQFEEL